MPILYVNLPYPSPTVLSLCISRLFSIQPALVQVDSITGSHKDLPPGGHRVSNGCTLDFKRAFLLVNSNLSNRVARCANSVAFWNGYRERKRNFFEVHPLGRARNDGSKLFCRVQRYTWQRRRRMERKEIKRKSSERWSRGIVYNFPRLSEERTFALIFHLR